MLAEHDRKNDARMSQLIPRANRERVTIQKRRYAKLPRRKGAAAYEGGTM